MAGEGDEAVESLRESPPPPTPFPRGGWPQAAATSPGTTSPTHAGNEYNERNSRIPPTVGASDHPSEYGCC